MIVGSTEALVLRDCERESAGSNSICSESASGGIAVAIAVSEPGAVATGQGFTT